MLRSHQPDSARVAVVTACPTNAMRILVIEDDPDVLAFIVKGLTELGHAVDQAADGKAGLLLATTEDYDVMIVDRMLPEIDGLTIVKSVRGAGKQTPMLILSALGEVDSRVEGLKAGGDDYASRPWPAVLHPAPCRRRRSRSRIWS
jgi:two-component system OmpR family response regulator